MEEAATGSGRIRQRRRTRRAIVQAATDLISRGRTPSVAQVAEAADVSRRTVYQYFPTQEQLITEAALAALEPANQQPIEMAGDDAESRLQALVETGWRVNDEVEHLGRTMIRLTVAADADRNAGAPGRGFARIEWIERALEPVRGRLDADAFERLVSALALCFGWEAFIVLKDVRGLDSARAERVSAWAAQALLRAALHEQSAAPDEQRREALPSGAPSAVAPDGAISSGPAAGAGCD